MQIQSGHIMLYQETDNRTPALTKQFRFEDKKRSVLASLARHDLALGPEIPFATLRSSHDLLSELPRHRFGPRRRPSSQASRLV
jgi:hypothetical protein